MKRLFWPLIIFLLNVALNAPLFLPGESKYRDSIEGGYASMALFFANNPNPFGWNPLQYGGMPAHLWYLPGIPYLSAAAIHLLPFLKPEHVYRLVTVTFACLPPVTLFFFMLYFTRSRVWAVMTALGYTFISPAYAVYPAIWKDVGITYVPWRIQTLIKYGEGPHNAGLALLPLTLMACWRAAITRGFPALFLAAILLAAVTLINWVAALGLAWCVLMLLLAGAGTGPLTGFLGRRVLFASALAYLLACFWLTPTFVRVTMFNWPTDAFGYRAQVTQYLLMVALVILPIALRFFFLRFPRQHFLCFAALCFVGFFFIVSAHYWFRVDTIPESRRYALEAELFFFVVVAETARQLSALRRPLTRDAAVALVTAFAAYGSLQAYDYVVHTWILLRPSPRELHPEFQVAKFLNDQGTEGRVAVLGGTRFRINSWFALPQLGGTFESGLQNRSAVHFLYQAATGLGSQPEHRVRDAIWSLRSYGVEYFAVHGTRSREHWHDVRDPSPFQRELQPIFDRDDDFVYRLPFRSLAVLVQPGELPPRRPKGDEVALLEPYVRALDDSARPTPDLRKLSNSSIEVSTAVPPGHWLNIAITHHPGWHAWQDGKPIAVEQSSLGHLLLKPEPASQSTIALEFKPSTEHIAFTILSLLVWAVSLAACWRVLRRA